MTNAVQQPEQSRPERATSDDRRRTGRVLVDGLSCSQGRVLDMSVSGFRLMRWTKWKAGECRRISLPVLAGRTMVISGRCQWCERVGLFKYRCGIEFLDLTEEHREALRHIALTNAKRAWCGVSI